MVGLLFFIYAIWGLATKAFGYRAMMIGSGGVAYLFIKLGKECMQRA